MHLGLRLFFGFFVITGIAAVFLLRVFLGEVKPSVREAIEDGLVDSANLMAEQVAPDLRALPPGGTLDGSRFAVALRAALERPLDARIWGLHKTAVGVRVYVTDAAGRLVFDSGGRLPAGEDFSRWRDVVLTLRGEYGARTSREREGDDRSSVLHVAAPVKAADGAVIGVLTLAKPVLGVQPFVDRAERKIFVAGMWMLGLSLAIGVAVTLWAVVAVRRLRRYAQQASRGAAVPVPALPGELGELARAMGEMRERLDHHAEVEQAVRALTHELKSPLAAIRGAAELLNDELPRADRERFATQVGDQVDRLHELVDRALELSKLQSLRAPRKVEAVAFSALVHRQCALLAPALAQHGLRIDWLADDAGAQVEGDADALALAVSNLLTNAVAFAPDGSAIDCEVSRRDGQLVFALRDRGPGAPDYALPRLGERYFSTRRPRDGAKGSGLGLAIVQQVAALHGGELSFEPATPGLRVQLRLPAAAR